MQGIIQHLVGVGPLAALVCLLAGLVYGLAGWRLIRQLAALDALLGALILAILIQEPARGALGDWPFWIAVAGLAALLPVAAWRFHRWSVLLMGGATGFAVTQLLLINWPPSVRVLSGVVCGGFTMACLLTLYRQTAAFVTGLHGGCFCVAGLAAMAAYPGLYGGALFNLVGQGPEMQVLLAAVFTIILTVIQFADLSRESDSIAVSNDLSV